MCGIWGYVADGNSIPVSDSWNGLCSLTDRGPDAWGMYIDGAGTIYKEDQLPNGDTDVALGNRRLSILDLSTAGNQPMEGPDGCQIVYNGEVYNYREIRQGLLQRGHSFSSDSDTEVVLHAYDEYGRDCVKRFRGMFAFAVYDPESGELFAARDRFGIKPFYYDATGESLAFASEVTSLLTGDVTRPDLDPQGVDGFLTFGFVPEPQTILQGVQALPAGCRLRYDADTACLDIDRYWRPQFEDGPRGDASTVRQRLEESVDLRLRSDVPVGAFLSGGLDSSTIVALMNSSRDSASTNLHTLSITFDDPAFSEGEHANTVSEAFGTNHSTTTVGPADVQAHADQIIGAMDQPTVDGVNTYFVSKLAADEGLKVVMSGLGSDELFCGYPSFERVPRLRRVTTLLNKLPTAPRSRLASGFETVGSQLNRPAIDHIGDLLRTSSPFGSAYETVRGLFGSRTRLALGTSVDDWAVEIENEVQMTLQNAGTLNAVSEAESHWYMRNQLLRDTDCFSMAHSLEVRVPFLDRKLASYLHSVSADSKARGEKALLKDAVDGIVPTEVLNRRKTGFTFPFTKWLDGPLSSLVNRALDNRYIQHTGLDVAACNRIRTGYERGNVHWSRLWAIVVLSLWVNRHLAGTARSS